MQKSPIWPSTVAGRTRLRWKLTGLLVHACVGSDPACYALENFVSSGAMSEEELRRVVVDVLGKLWLQAARRSHSLSDVEQVMGRFGLARVSGVTLEAPETLKLA